MTAKRILDITVSALGLLLLIPLFVVVAACIVIEDGRPVLFAHERQGRGGRPFRCWKFRSMYRDSRIDSAAIQERNACDGPQVFIRDDPRVSRVGRIMRRLQIDELPQLWNVLKGDMSLVGPRPSPDDENQYCPAWRELRLSVRPGITGLWQIERTRAVGQDFQEWIRYDVEYVRQAGFWFDLRICMRTIGVLLRGIRR